MVTCVLMVLLDGDLVQTPEHLGVSYLAAVLRRAGHSCVLVDIPATDDEQAVERLVALRPKVVGISLTTVNLPRAIALGQKLRAALGPEIHICAGGPIATFMGNALLKIDAWSFLDSIVRGEGEPVIVPLVEAVLRGTSVADVPGVIVPGQTALHSPVVAAEGLDTLPFPARDQLEALNGRVPFVRISTSRGCTSYCTFCNAPHARNNLAKRKVWRSRHPEDVVAEIEHLIRTYHVDTFEFVDSTFEDPGGKVGKDRVRRIAELLLERDLRVFYHTCSQAHNWTDTPGDHELLSLLFRSGLEKTLIGIESGSDRSLKLFKKRSSTEDNRRALWLFRTHGVYVAFGFIMFHAYSEWEDIENNVAFLLENFGHNLRPFLTRLELYPGAEIVHQIESDGLLDPEYWTTLRPYAYRYVNPEVGRMARLINSLFGQAHVEQSGITHEPSVFAFEAFDSALHTSISRLLRSHADNPTCLVLIREHGARLEEEKASLTQFNGDLFYDMIHRARTGGDLPNELPKQVEQRYAQAINRIRALQLRLGIQLHSAGVQTLHREVTRVC